ncbi:MAG: hypothetical protein GTO22_01035, partial [Gemmatimonadales bacterium]|nr:hypothetical protein [Gemmatimonadales bacterium]
ETTVDQDWAVHALTTPGAIPLHWDDTVDVLPPSFDWDPSNNTSSLDIVIDNIDPGADADVKITDQSFTSVPA